LYTFQPPTTPCVGGMCRGFLVVDGKSEKLIKSLGDFRDNLY